MSLLDPILPERRCARRQMGQAVRRGPGARHRRSGGAAARARSSSLRRIRATQKRLSDEIRFFAGPGLPVRVFPDLETLPYDGFSAHPDITSARLATLAELPRARHGVWLVAIDTLLQRLAPRSYIEAYSLKVHVGETPRSGSAARAAGAGRICRRHAGRGARRIRGPRLADRRLSHGLGYALSNRHAGSRRRQHPPLRSGHAALARTSWTAFSCCRRARRR